MTARAMLLSNDAAHKAAVHYAAPELNHPNAKKEMAEYLERDRIEAFEEGAEHTRTLYEADRSKLLDEIERLKAMVPKWVEFWYVDGLWRDANGAVAAPIENWEFTKSKMLGERCFWLMVPPIPLPEPKGDAE